MPSIKDLKRRITSVKSTQQTTKAMKLVSAAKLRRAQDAIVQHRPYAKALLNVLSHLSTTEESTSQAKSPLLGDPERKVRKVTLLVVTSDRGLCGGFNGSIIKGTQKWIRDHGSKYESVEIAFVGKKGFEFFKSRGYAASRYFEEVGGKVSFAKAKLVSDELVASYVSGKTDQVKVIYNEFINAVTQKVSVVDFLPLNPETLKVKAETTGAELPVILKPNRKELLEKAIERSFPVQIYRSLLESQAGEHGARMSAMENATKNAGEMIRKLNLQYNKQRQASITKELLEIISGSESQAKAS